MHWPDPDQGRSGGPHAGGHEPTGHPPPPAAAAWTDAHGEYAAPLGASPGARPGSPVPGPRQEYLDAFDTTPQGAAGSADGPAGGYQPGGGRGHRRPRRAARDQDQPQPRPRTQPPAPPEPSSGAGPATEPGGARSHSWARTVTGLVAAAVVVVLTVGVYDGDAAGDGEGAAEDGAAAPGPPAGGGEEPDDADAGDEAVPDGEAEEEPRAHSDLSYEEAMDTVFDVDPELTGSGELAPVPGSEPAAFDDALTELRYRVDVEEGLGLDPEVFAEAVHTTLNDPRGWYNNGERSFTRVSSGQHDFVITLASPGTTHEWCGKADLDTEMDNVSCDSATTERVMINAWRWAQGAETYGDDDIHAYRQMLINHEVGHRIGYGHAVCPAEGAPAPVMMQQTKFLTTDGITCEPNSWPHPGNG